MRLAVVTRRVVEVHSLFWLAQTPKLGTTETMLLHMTSLRADLAGFHTAAVFVSNGTSEFSGQVTADGWLTVPSQIKVSSLWQAVLVKAVLVKAVRVKAVRVKAVRVKAVRVKAVRVTRVPVLSIWIMRRQRQPVQVDTSSLKSTKDAEGMCSTTTRKNDGRLNPSKLHLAAPSLARPREGVFGGGVCKVGIWAHELLTQTNRYPKLPEVQNQGTYSKPEF